MLTSSRSTSPFFSKIPLELRCLVYNECLFVGEVAAYKKSTTSNASHPQLSLLCTCRRLKVEAEPVIYQNTVILRKEEDIQSFFQKTIPTPARKLLPKSIEVSLGRDDFTTLDSCMVYNHGITKSRGLLASSGSINEYNREIHRFAKLKLRDATWQRKVDPILDHLRLDRLILDLSDSFCPEDCDCRMAAMAVLCFEKGFAVHTPKIVEVKGWELDDLDIAAVVGECLGTWTMRRAGKVAGDADSALGTISEAEKWLLDMASEEEGRSCS